MELVITPDTYRDHAICRFMDSMLWAMEPARYDVLVQVVADHMAGRNVKLSSVDAYPEQFTDVMVIPIVGTVMKKAYGLNAISGARTTLDIRKDIQTALQNPAINGIVLDIDSPGGTVDGTKDLADYILAAKEIKPIVVYANGMMASAAMWIGSAGSYRIGGATTNIGSVGVRVEHHDYSKIYEAQGVKVTHIFAGKYKVMGVQDAPLSKDAKEYIQHKIDSIYTIFVDDIASNLELETQYVIDNIATGAIFLGQEALELKLIDSLGTLETAIEKAHNLGGEKMVQEEKTGTVETQVILTSLEEKLDAMQKQLETATAKAEESAAALATNVAATAKKEHLEVITALFDGCDVDESFVTAMAELDKDVAITIAGVVSSKQKQVDEVLGKLETPAGITTEHKVIGDTPKSVDAAIDMIEARDDIDTEAAMEKVVGEFPSLFEQE